MPKPTQDKTTLLIISQRSNAHMKGNQFAIVVIDRVTLLVIVRPNKTFQKNVDALNAGILNIWPMLVPGIQPRLLIQIQLTNPQTKFGG